ncbi:hypothetical protein FRB90_010641 [Tulasnella sp. 427]|nr:hypothetical protein FRB90_010641 [Tulasnella sp. 427]
MSLANANSEISAHPGKNSVTHATDRAAQAADVDRKMRLYGVIEAFRAGKVPDNQQIDETLRYVNSHSPVNVNELSPEGQKLISDARDIIETARLITAGSVAQDAKGTAQAHVDETKAAMAAENPDGTKKSLKERLVAGYNSVADRVPDEHKDRANQHIERGKNFLRDEFPEDRRDQFIYRLKKVIVECQKHQDYVQALTWFLDTFESYIGHGKNLTSNTTGQASDVLNDPSLRQASTELRTLLERFANGRSMEGIEDASRALYEDAQKDEGLRNWFREFDDFIRKTLLEPGYVLSPQCSRRWDELTDSGRAYFTDKYKGHMDNLFDALSAWFKAWADDPLLNRFSSDWKRLTKDLLFDADGNLTFKPQLWGDIRRVILPAVIEKVGYIPIPRIEYTDNTLDLVIENLTLQGQNLFPNIISMEAHNFLQFSPYRAIEDKNHHNFTFTFSQVQADMRDVAFYFNKKNGFPKIKDSGLADVFLGGEGLTVTVQLASADSKDRSSVFHVKHVNVKLDSLKFSVRDSKHDLLYKTLKPLATGLVKKQISKAITDAITTGFEYIDEQLVQVRDSMDQAKNNDSMSRKDAIKALYERKQEEVASKKETAHAKAGSQFKISLNDSNAIDSSGVWFRPTKNIARQLKAVEQDTIEVFERINTGKEEVGDMALAGYLRQLWDHFLYTLATPTRTQFGSFEKPFPLLSISEPHMQNALSNKALGRSYRIGALVCRGKIPAAESVVAVRKEATSPPRKRPTRGKGRSVLRIFSSSEEEDSEPESDSDPLGEPVKGYTGRKQTTIEALPKIEKDKNSTSSESDSASPKKVYMTPSLRRLYRMRATREKERDDVEKMEICSDDNTTYTYPETLVDPGSTPPNSNRKPQKGKECLHSATTLDVMELDEDVNDQDAQSVDYRPTRKIRSSEQSYKETRSGLGRLFEDDDTSEEEFFNSITPADDDLSEWLPDWAWPS